MVSSNDSQRSHGQNQDEPSNIVPLAHVPLVKLGPGGDFVSNVYTDAAGPASYASEGFDAAVWRLVRMGIPRDLATHVVGSNGPEEVHRAIESHTFHTDGLGRVWRVVDLRRHSVRVQLPPGTTPPQWAMAKETGPGLAPVHNYDPCGCGAPEQLAQVQVERNALNVKTSFTLPPVPRLTKSLEVAASLSAMAGCAAWAYFGGLSALGGLIVGCVLAVAFMRLARHVRLTAPTGARA